MNPLRSALAGATYLVLATACALGCGAGVAPPPAALPDLIELQRPLPGDLLQSPVTIAGRARGPWYFEASFPVYLLDAEGDTIARIPARANGEWMTTEFVPFSATLTFTTPASRTGTLILAKDNPSGLPEHAAELRVAVRFH